MKYHVSEFETVLSKRREMVFEVLPEPTIASCALMLQTLLHESPLEKFVSLMFNSNGDCLGYEVVAIGTENKTLISIRAVLRTAILACASALVIGHNHPTGNVQPSPQDVKFTSDIEKAASLFGVRVIDHIIVTHVSNEYYSFNEGGFLNDYRE